MGPRSGKHARYDPDAVYLAAVLNTLAERGLQVSQQRKLVEAFRAFNPLQKLEAVHTKGQDIKLLLMVSRLDGEQMSIAIQSDRRLDAPVASSRRFFGSHQPRLNWAGLEEGGEA